LSRRQVFGLVASAIAAIAVTLTATAQTPPERVLRVGFISMAPSAQFDIATIRRQPLWQRYDQEMRKRGWIEGRNLVTLFRTTEGKLERVPDLAAELARSKAEVIMVPHIAMAVAGSAAAPSVPFFSLAADPIARGVVQNLNRPGGNINGIFASAQTGTSTVEQKRLELLRDMVPRMRRVAFVATREWWEGIWGAVLREAAARFGLEVLYVETTSANFAEPLATLRRRKPDAVYFESSPSAFSHRVAVGNFAATSGIPTACGHQELVEAGCLMTYNFTNAEGFDAMVDFIDRVAKGARAGDLPYRQYSRYELALNARTAKAIGLAIPQSVLLRADRVIE